jgi:signal transduction histidine kinase
MDGMISDRAVIETVLNYICEFAPLVFLVLDPEGRVRDANGYAEGIIGSDPRGEMFEDLVLDFTESLRLSDFLDDPDRERMLDIPVPDDHPQTFRFRFYPREDHVLVFGRRDPEEEDRIRREILSLNAEMANLTRDLHRKNAELVRLGRLKDEFLGMAAHDLRQPISSIQGYTEILVEEAGESLDGEHRGYLLRILETSRRMRRLVDQFLSTSVIEMGRLDLEPRRCHLDEIVNSAVEFVAVEAGKRKIRLETDLPAPCPELLIDPAKVEQVLINLLTNALEYSPPRTRVFVSARREADEVVVTVRDEGPGISSGKAKRLFETPDREPGTKADGKRGTGLGLVIARKMVEAHGGRIWVDSEPGMGSAFRFSLPAG